jgi:membrane protein
VVSTQVAEAQAATDGNVALIGGLVALWGASRGASALTVALNRVFTVEETRPFWWRQVLAILVTAMVALLIVLALALLLFGPTIGHAVADRYHLGATFDTLWETGRWIGAGALMTFVWALRYRLLPNHHAPLRIFTPGAIIGVLLWVGVSRAMTYFVSTFTDFEATYGALASAVTFLLWLWLSNLALLIGAEITDVLHRPDVRASSPAPAKTAPQIV